MPTTAKGHSEMQKSVCIMCFKKPKHLKNISSTISELFKKLVLQDYQSEKWVWLPNVMPGLIHCFTVS